jgi:hypothetical protein
MKKKRDRTHRRELSREQDKLTEARIKLAALEVGGSPERPAQVDSASQIEGRAETLGCLRCETPMKIREHRALHHVTGTLREVELSCPRCGARRLTYYRVGPTLN